MQNNPLEVETLPPPPETPVISLPRQLAQQHQQLLPEGAGQAFTGFLGAYQSLFEEAIRRFRSASIQELAVSYAAEWMLDNDFLIIQALHQIEEDLPPHYARQLPRLAQAEDPTQPGPELQLSLAGAPRVYALGRALVLSQKVHLDPDAVREFVQEYQAVTPLTMGELWALPIMLRLVVLQVLALSAATLTGLEDRHQALPLPSLDLPGALTHEEAIANGFLSLRMLFAEDWKDFFESLSLVEQILAQDPARAYLEMDFETRNQYRRAVEELAAGSGQSELEVARLAIQRAEQAAGTGDGGGLGEAAQVKAHGGDTAGRRNGAPYRFGQRRSHVGYSLLGQDRPVLETQIGYQPEGRLRFQRWALEHPGLAYFGSLAILLVLGLGGLAAYAAAQEASPWLALILSLVPVLTLVVHLLNWIVTRSLPPRVLPKMDFKDGLPPETASLVVVPALINDLDEVLSLLTQLELHYLRNPDPHLFFALLSDLQDADQSSLPEDEVLVERTCQGIERLNYKYPRPNGAPFLLFHRDRRWNPSEGKWIGWERKRGKLHQLNQAVLAARGLPDPNPAYRPEDGQAGAEAFAVRVGDLSALPPIRYIITLDADTILPPGAGRRLVATLAHPLNQAELDAAGNVLAGYTVLQPRPKINPESALYSPFTRLFSDETGLDLYTLAVSDVYQDLFGDGIYVGKGIYDVEAFERSLAGRAPENALLSHDLFEGIHGRTGLVTDIVLVENYPSGYLGQARRLHRWIRGDWQIFPWLFGRVPVLDAGGRRTLAPTRLGLLDRWKVLDNLRRSLVGLASLALLGAAWSGLLPGSPVFWTLTALLPLSLSLLDDLISLPSRLFGAIREKRRPASALESLPKGLLRSLFAIAMLPYDAAQAGNAVLVTLQRVYVTHRHLLNWTTAAEAEKQIQPENARQATWRSMLAAPLAAVGFGLLIAWLSPTALWVAGPILLAWLVAPEIAYRLSLPVRREPAYLDLDEVTRLRVLARQTWLFFEQFVGPEDHWLPPDHFQEAPLGVVAHRTSPTNIGLNLIATLGAFDLGYIGPLALVARLRSAFDNLAGLERYQGHFLNWYDTRSLEPLQPHYISTVDSGNLAACLIALRQGLLRLDEAPVLRWSTLQSLLDSFELLLSLLEDQQTPGRGQVIGGTMQAALQQARQVILSTRSTPERWGDLLLHLTGMVEDEALSWNRLEGQLVEMVEESALELGSETLRRLRLYAEQARGRVITMQRELTLLLPWLGLLAQAPSGLARAAASPDLAAAWEALRTAFPPEPSLAWISRSPTLLQPQIAALLEALPAAGLPADALLEARTWCDNLQQQLNQASQSAKALNIGHQQLANEAEAYFNEMDFTFLFDPERQIFHIGYNSSMGQLDNNYYDLLASEARIASLVAIAKGDVPESHWLHLARPLTEVNGRQGLLSWSATMFEYLMPHLLLRSFEGTLLHESALAATEIQIDYTKDKNVPWGISESGYYRFDPSQAYQYRAFGVPGLGYKRGLRDDLVIAGYASILALPLFPKEVVQNLARLDQFGGRGAYGLYEAIDFTPGRTGLGNRWELVREYMAHHQGMILLSLVNLFEQNVMVQRFHADPRIQSVELLLQEKYPEDATLVQPHIEEMRATHPQQPQVVMMPWRARVNAPQPRVHFLSNGRYGLLLTAAGGGYSSYREKDLTRWRADTTLGNWGTWIYLQDVDSHRIWSVGYLPTAQAPDGRDVYFNAHQAVYTRRDGDLTSSMEVTVHPDDDVEVRLISLTNHGDQPIHLRLTSYGEVTLVAQAADHRHPVFSSLFVESEWLAGENLLLFHRRPRSDEEETLWMGHLVVVEGSQPLTNTYEASRERFVGRGQTTRLPQALASSSWLSGTVGATLDPIFAIGQEILLPPHDTVRLAYLTLVAPTRAQAQALAARYRDWPTVSRAFDRARGQAEIELSQLGMHSPQLPRIQHLLSALLFPHQSLRAPADTLRANRKGQPALWPYAISGDYPILLARIGGLDEMSLVNDLIQAHTYWRNRNLKIDLVLLNEQGANYGQELNGQIHRVLARTGSDAWMNRRGGIFLLLADQLGPEDRTLLETAARVVLDGKRGALMDQLPAVDRLPPRLPAFIPTLPDEEELEPTSPLPRPDGLQFDNGWGGFSPDGREYCITIEPGRPTPAPWVNVVANPDFGFLVSESTLGATWAINSGENRLTPWYNDPVSDPPGEALYLRDEETGSIWSATPQPIPSGRPYLVRHGAGYSIFEHHHRGLKQRLRLFAAPDDPLKILHLRLENEWNRVRRITVTYFVEWVLGVHREQNQGMIVPEFDGEVQALLARNAYNVEFGERVAFAASGQNLHSLTADRTEFLGRMGSKAHPAGLVRIGLSGAVAPGLDPAAVLQVHLDLQPGEAKEVFFLLGQGADRAAALELAHRYRQPEAVEAAWQAVNQRWDELLGAVQVETPDPAMDLVLNRWLLYQSLACRIWGRSAFYQSSGAYGFRDQLQDVMSVIHTAPELARQHLLRAAQYQFELGDVLHWWHPPSGRGVRTRFSDDLLWLPYVTAYYVQSTGDTGVLDEMVPFLQGKPLDPGQDEAYAQYSHGPGAESLYEHCRRAIERGHALGSHGLPLMGSGDWNDGMNRVGIEGRGESIWLAWFLISVLNQFALISQERGDGAQANLYRQQASALAQALEKSAWDGQWYLRAFYDDGSPLGSARNRECQIDSLAQSWAVISQAAQPERARQGMDAALSRLVRWEDRLVLLFDPPFNHTPRDPGYIKGYLPGIRENGGQYTHAATWLVWAVAELGDGDQAGELFRLLNPILHGDDLKQYRVEPYVVAADIYSVPPHAGRGGWTWYTGSAGWYYRLGLEALLGLRREGQALRLSPCIPRSWPGFRIRYRFGQSHYEIAVENPEGVSRGVREVTLDGQPLPDGAIPLQDDGETHQVQVRLGGGI